MSQPGAADRIKKKKKEEEEQGGVKEDYKIWGVLGSLFMGEVPLRMISRRGGCW